MARYLGKSRPTVEDDPMKMLDPAQRADVQKAMLLLRLARALNLGRSGAVEKVRVSSAERTSPVWRWWRRGMGVDLELWAIEKEKSYFREVFGRELSAAAV